MKNAKYLKSIPELNTHRWICPFCEDKFNHQMPKVFHKKIKCRVCNNPLKVAFPDIGFIKLVFICVTIPIFVILLVQFSFSPLLNQGTIYDIIAGYSYNAVANNWEDHQISRSFAVICLNFEDKERQVKCVYELIAETQYLVENREESFFRENSNILRTREEIFTKGGVCRDVTVLASSVFNLLDINNSMIQVPRHIYNEVYLEGRKTCHVDIAMGIYYCSYPVVGEEATDINNIYKK